jgi:putative membrane protein
MITLCRLAAALAVLASLGGCDRDPMSAGSAASSAVAVAEPLDAADQRFVAQAAADGLFHSRVAQLAARKARDPDVKAFAEMMAAHQSAAQAQLRQIATAHAVALPHAMPADHRELLDQLDGLSTPEFERRFVQIIGVQEQRRCMAEFAEAARTVQDQDVQSFARAMLGMTKWQLAAAQQLPAALRRGA